MDDPRFPPPPTAASAEQPLHPPKPPDDQISAGKGVKETVESILIAFILAFVFRAFVVEAFVIPTGSMATTLMGAHMRFTCKECGYQFEAEYHGRETGTDEIDIPARADGRSFGIYCPNCRYKVAENEATDPMVRYGDRILVLKYLYIPWISEPHRWDVVVFKSPATPPSTVPPTPYFATNYIKRLIGLPKEKIIIIDGDVYVWSGKHWPPDYSHPMEKENWKIQSKPRYAQDAMWRIIYDHDYRPLHDQRPTNYRHGDSGEAGSAALMEHWKLPWVAASGSGWDTGDSEHSRVLAFNNPTGQGVLKFDPTTVPRYDPSSAPGGYFTDWLAYDATMYQLADRGTGPRSKPGDNFAHSGDYPVDTVSDFKLTFFYERKSGDGALKARMTKHDHEFVLEMLPDHLRLVHRLPDKTQEEIPVKINFNPSGVSGPIRVDFANADYHVTVRINDELAFETTDVKGAKGYYQPNVDELWDRYVTRRKNPFPTPTVAIEAQRQQAQLSHVSLWRDVYYTSRNIDRASPITPAEVDDGEYFVMGDNSAASSDARMWGQRVDLPEESLKTEAGRVPARFMMGRAFFVYWPAGYRPINSAPALVPDFGDMRLIH